MVPEVEAARIAHQPVWELPPNLEQDRQGQFTQIKVIHVVSCGNKKKKPQAIWNYTEKANLHILSENVLHNRLNI